MRILLWVEYSGSFANGLHQPLFPQLFRSCLGDEAAATAFTDEGIDALHKLVW